MPPPAGQIKHLVCLMMENRSFDHMLGFLASPAYPVEGLNGTESVPDSQGIPAVVSKDAGIAGDFTPDPGHHYPDVNLQIFGNYQAVPSGPLMQGFVTSYETHTHNVKRSRRIMKCYDPEDPRKIPALATLAKQYAVCDHWFCSVPGPTLPNRAFLHAATSNGRVDMNPLWHDMPKTIYELLDEHGVRSNIYFQDFTVAMTFGQFAGNQSKWFASYDDFFDDCKRGTLPGYSLIEPRYNDSSDAGHEAASDQHPDHDIRAGDRMIRDVYDALRSNRQLWESTILVVMYDEHGGLYDHVPPPAAVSPDGKVATNVSENLVTNPPIPPFSFDRLGPRVPGLVISPWIEPLTIDRTVYDHTSVIATARKLFLGANWQNLFLTERDRQAAAFDGLLTRSTPRTDLPDLPAVPFDELPEPVIDSLDKALTAHQRALVDQTYELEQQLPPDRRTGTVASEITTERQASAYMQAVTSQFVRPRAKRAAE